jgi:hypothetical protein
MCGFGDCIKGKLNSGAKVEGRDRRGDVSRVEIAPEYNGAIGNFSPFK